MIWWPPKRVLGPRYLLVYRVPEPINRHRDSTKYNESGWGRSNETILRRELEDAWQGRKNSPRRAVSAVETQAMYELVAKRYRESGLRTTVSLKSGVRSPVLQVDVLEGRRTPSPNSAPDTHLGVGFPLDDTCHRVFLCRILASSTFRVLLYFTAKKFSFMSPRRF